MNPPLILEAAVCLGLALLAAGCEGGRVHK
jgi:hypothetical protein